MQSKEDKILKQLTNIALALSESEEYHVFYQRWGNVRGALKTRTMGLILYDRLMTYGTAKTETIKQRNKEEGNTIMTQQTQQLAQQLVQLPANVRFCHVRDEVAKQLFGKREFTIAYTYDPVANTFFAAFSYCSLKDAYTRKLGNAKAAERLQQGLSGVELESQYFLPIHNATLFNTHKDMLQFAIVWGKQFQ